MVKNYYIINSMLCILISPRRIVLWLHVSTNLAKLPLTGMSIQTHFQVNWMTISKKFIQGIPEIPGSLEWDGHEVAVSLTFDHQNLI